MGNVVSKWSSAIDYATITCDWLNEQAWNVSVGGAKLIEENERENERTPLSARGGYKGVQCGNVGVMDNGKWLVVRLSGGGTERGIVAVWHDGCHLTRVDMQTTVWYSSNLDALMRRHKDTAEKAIKSGVSKRLKVTETKDTLGGHTIYIGSRSSQTYLRIYKKFEESGLEEYRGAIRYEIEIKDDVARGLGDRLCGGIVEEQGVSIEARLRIAATVRDVFSKSGVYLPDTDGLPFVLAGEQERTDAARKLEWLAKQVAPTVRWLAARGMEKEALEALGLFGGEVGGGEGVSPIGDIVDTSAPTDVQ